MRMISKCILAAWALVCLAEGQQLGQKANKLIASQPQNQLIPGLPAYINRQPLDQSEPKQSPGTLAQKSQGSRIGKAPLLERFSWKSLDWNFPSESIKQDAIASGKYQPTNSLPVGIEIWKEKLFVTVPRWGKGIPATLNYIPLDKIRGGSPKLTPYPDLASNAEDACETGLTTAYRIHADKCNRLWVLDSGTIGNGNNTVQACPFALNVFDLNTDKRIRRYQLRPEDVNKDTFIANIAVDLGKGGCDDAFAYMSDELGYGLIVYSWQQNKSWRLFHSYFLPDPLAGEYNIAGLNFQWGKQGIFGMSLSPMALDGYRTLYFHSLSSNREFSVSTRILRNEKLSMDTMGNWHEFRVLPERGPLGHSTAEIMDDDGLQFFTQVDQNAVGCWNSKYPYAPQNQAIIARHDEAMIFPADVKSRRGLLWIMTDRMPVYDYSTFNYSDTNFRILTVPVRDAIAGTVCDKSPAPASAPASAPAPSLGQPSGRIGPVNNYRY